MWLTLCAAAFAAPKQAAELRWFKDFTGAEFRKQPAAQQAIDPAKLDEPLLAAAIFHETNRRREKLKLSRLQPHANVRAAALKHAKKMAKGNYLSHGTPKQKESTTPYQRMKQEGLEPAFVAENVAYNYVLRYESGKPFYKREENGKAIYSYSPEASSAAYLPKLRGVDSHAVDGVAGAPEEYRFEGAPLSRGGRSVVAR